MFRMRSNLEHATGLFYHANSIVRAILSDLPIRLVLMLVAVLLSVTAAKADTIPGGNITSNTTWAISGSPYVVTGLVKVYGNGTPRLTIRPGVEVQFMSGAYLHIGEAESGNIKPGELHAIGTPDSMIVLTSHSGDPGGWSGLYFDPACDYGGATSELSYCVIEKAASYNIYVDRTTQPTLSHCIIRKSADRGLRVRGDDGVLTASNCRFDSCVTGAYAYDEALLNISASSFTGNTGYGIYMDSTTRPNLSGNTFTDNGTGIALFGGKYHRHWSVTWHTNNGEPYTLLNPLILRQARLYIDPGVEVRCAPGSRIQVGEEFIYYGELHAVGTPDSMIVFASLSGDPGGWSGLYFRPGSQVDGATSEMSYCVVENAGSYNVFVDRTTQPSTIDNCIIRKASDRGLRVRDAVITATDCQFDSCGTGAYAYDEARLNINNSSFTGNTDYGIYMDSNTRPNLSGNTFTDNGTGIALSGGSYVSHWSVTWHNNNGEPYTLLGPLILRQASLYIDPGVEVRCAPGARIQMGEEFVYYGELHANGTPDSMIVFTSLSGDPGGWSGLYFRPGSQVDGATSEMSYCVVENAASYNIYIDRTTQPTIDHCVFRNATGRGMRIRQATVSAGNCEFYGNDVGVYCYENCNVTLGNTPNYGGAIYNNTSYNVHNDMSNHINARYNYWGSSDSSLIAEGIYDNHDDPSKGIVYYSGFVRSHNAGLQEILSPVGPIPLGIAQTPQVVVTNTGFNHEVGTVSINIAGAGYSESTAFDLDGGELDTISFPDWTPTEAAGHLVLCSLVLAGDEIPGDDILESSVSATTGSGPEVHLISPNVSTSGVVLPVVITGQNFEEGMTARLILSGESDIVADSIVVNATYDTLTATFDLTDAVIDRWDLEVSASGGGSYYFYKGFNVVFYDGELLPFCQWEHFIVHDGSTIDIGGVNVPRSGDIFMLLKKSNRIGYSGTWFGDVTVTTLAGAIVASASGGSDVAFHLENPASGLYELSILAYDPGEGNVMFCSSLTTVTLGDWYIGEILRPYGFDWVQFDVPPGQTTLYVQTEGYGQWSTIMVYHESLSNPTQTWYFNNPPNGFHIEGEIPNPDSGRYYLRYMDSAVLYGNPADQVRQYMLWVDTEPAPDTSLSPTITGLSTYVGGQGPVTVIVSGTGLDSAATVSLVRDGYDDLVADYVFGDSTRIELAAVFNLTAVELGEWLFVVSNPNGEADTAATGFEVEPAAPEGISVEIIGRDAIRIGRWSAYVFRCVNSGNVDALDPMILATVPDGFSCRMDVPLTVETDDSSITAAALLVSPRFPVHHSEDVVVWYLANGSSTEPITALIYDPDIAEGSYKMAIAEMLQEYSQREAPFGNSCDDTPMPGEFVFQQFGWRDWLPPVPWPAHVGMYYETDIGEGRVIDFLDKLPTDGVGGCVNGRCRSASTCDGGCYRDMTWIGWKNLSANPCIGHARPPCWSEAVGRAAAAEALRIYNDGDLPPEYELVPACGDEEENCLTWLAEIYGETSCLLGFSPKTWPINVFKRWGLQEQIQKNSLKMVPSWSDGKGEYGTTVQCIIQQSDTSDSKPITPVGSSTPEDKYGPSGFDHVETSMDSLARFVTDTRSSYSYRIDYWNHEEASADAQIVMIKDTIDTDYDITTFRFTEFGFLRWTVPLEGVQYFNVDVDMRPDMDLIVNVEGYFDPDHRAIDWTFTSHVPGSDTLPELIGFLPPIDSLGYNIGWVDFEIDPIPGLATGTQIANQAFVNFDSMPPCPDDTCEYWSPAPKLRPWLNTIDAGPPESYVLALDSITEASSFAVQWSGHDDDTLLGSGLKWYTVYYAVDDTSFIPWLENTTDTLATFDLGTHPHTYYFYSVATDNVGHEETVPDTYDTKTTIDYLYICGDVNGSGAELDISDLVYLVDYMFNGGPPPPKPEAADMADCSGEIDISDLVYLVDYMFNGGPAPCALCGGTFAAKSHITPSKGVCNLQPQMLTKDRHSLIISGDFDTDVAGFQQEYRYDRSEVVVDSVIRHADNYSVDLYWNAEDGKLSLGMIDIYGKLNVKSGRSQLATIYYHTLGSEVDSLGGLTHVFTKAAERGARLLQLEVYSGTAQPNLPKTYALHQNYPNPFNSQTIIKYDLPKASNVQITIYNILGQRVNNLVNGEQPAGFHQITWDGDNVQGKTVASGVYFYRITAEGFTQSKKMVLLK